MRTPAYQGVMAARVYAAQQEEREAEQGPPDPDEVPGDIEATLAGQMEIAG